MSNIEQKQKILLKRTTEVNKPSIPSGASHGELFLNIASGANAHNKISTMQIGTNNAIIWSDDVANEKKFASKAEVEALVNDFNGDISALYSQKVDKTTTVNGQALSSNVTITKVNSASTADSAITSVSATTADKVKNSLTVGSKTYNGSNAVTITAADLGLESALKYHGKTKTILTDGATTNPIILSDGTSHTALTGCVVISSGYSGDTKEFFWNGSKWEELGDESSWKPKQSAKTDPTANGSGLTFIDTISQDVNGVITATKKAVNLANYSLTGHNHDTVYWKRTEKVNSASTANSAIKDGNGNNIVENYALISDTVGKLGVLNSPDDRSAVIPNSITNLWGIDNTMFSVVIYERSNSSASWVEKWSSDSATTEQKVNIEKGSSSSILHTSTRGSQVRIVVSALSSRYVKAVGLYLVTKDGTYSGNIDYTAASYYDNTVTESNSGSLGTWGNFYSAPFFTRSATSIEYIFNNSGANAVIKVRGYRITTANANNPILIGKALKAYEANSASTADSAIKDGSGNNIVNTYATKSSIPTSATVSNWGFTKNAGTVTGVTAGNGLTGGGSKSTGSTGLTLNVGAGTGISVSTDAVGISSDYQNKIASGVSAHTMVKELIQDIEDNELVISTIVTKINDSCGFDENSESVLPNGQKLTEAIIELQGQLPVTLPTASTTTLGMMKVGSFLKATTGNVSVSTGTTSSTVARGDHGHAASSITSGTFNTARIPTGITVSKAISATTSVSATTSHSATTVYSTTANSKVYLVGVTGTGSSYQQLYKNTGVTMSASCIYATSDERLKDFKGDIECDLEKLKNIPKKYFSWKDDESKSIQIGTSAQEVHKLYPEIVSIDDDGTHSVAYDRLSIVALSAIDKLYDMVKELQTKNDELENRVKELEKK